MNLQQTLPVRDRKGDAPNFAHKPAKFEPEHSLVLKEFGRVNLRPISIEDENEMVDFHESLSEESIYLRYFEHISLDTRTLHERLARVCANTADSFAIVAETGATSRHPAQILAVGRLTTSPLPNKASFAMLIADRAKDTDLPEELLKRLLAVARAYHFRTLSGELLVADHDTLNLCRSLGFKLHTVPEDGIVRVNCAL
jgi:acetyltransferase